MNLFGIKPLVKKLINQRIKFFAVNSHAMLMRTGSLWISRCYRYAKRNNRDAGTLAGFTVELLAGFGVELLAGFAAE
jgi:hypothetical protein